MKMLSPHERALREVQLLRAGMGLRLRDMCERFGVSLATAKRDRANLRRFGYLQEAQPK